MRSDAEPLKKGEKFGDWTSLGECEARKCGQKKVTRWYEKVICLCGKISRVRRGELRAGKSQGCGCKRNKDISKRFTTHGESKTRFYRIYRGILGRCRYIHQNNKNYSGKGIKCMWNSFGEFKKDMWDGYVAHVKEFGEKNTTIDRIDPEGDYCKENCRWATWVEQENNRTNNRKFLYGISSDTLSEETGLSKCALQGMLRWNNGDFDKFIKNLEKRFGKTFIYKKNKNDNNMS